MANYEFQFVISGISEGVADQILEGVVDFISREYKAAKIGGGFREVNETEEVQDGQEAGE